MDYGKKKCCCGVFERGPALENVTKLIALSDFFLLGGWLYFYILLFLGSIGALESGWFKDYTYPLFVNEKMFLEIFAAIMFVMLPLNLMLLYKITKGYAWFRDKKRGNFHNFYFASLVFYITFLL
jgi:hypothetical protein